MLHEKGLLCCSAYKQSHDGTIPSLFVRTVLACCRGSENYKNSYCSGTKKVGGWAGGGGLVATVLGRGWTPGVWGVVAAAVAGTRGAGGSWDRHPRCCCRRAGGIATGTRGAVADVQEA
jgi:hypothetical protein